MPRACPVRGLCLGRAAQHGAASVPRAREWRLGREERPGAASVPGPGVMRARARQPVPASGSTGRNTCVPSPAACSCQSPVWHSLVLRKPVPRNPGPQEPGSCRRCTHGTLLATAGAGPAAILQDLHPRHGRSGSMACTPHLPCAPSRFRSRPAACSPAVGRRMGRQAAIAFCRCTNCRMQSQAQRPRPPGCRAPASTSHRATASRPRSQASGCGAPASRSRRATAPTLPTLARGVTPTNGCGTAHTRARRHTAHGCRAGRPTPGTRGRHREQTF